MKRSLAMDNKKALELSLSFATKEFFKILNSCDYDINNQNSIYNIKLQDFIMLCNQKGINTRFVDKAKEVQLMLSYQDKLDSIRKKKDLSFDEIKLAREKVHNILVEAQSETNFEKLESLLKTGLTDLQQMQAQNIMKKHLMLFQDFVSDYSDLVKSCKNNKLIENFVEK